jgi:hypothetical protein
MTLPDSLFPSEPFTLSTLSNPSSSSTSARDAAYWARLAGGTLSVGAMPPEAVNLNVEGHRVLGPLQGFGPLWKKTFRTRLVGRSDVTPAEVVRVWKAEFPRFWPRGQHFYPSAKGFVPGEVALLNLRVGLPLETGMLVLYADDESFTLMTPQGHMYASWITFSADRAEDDCTVAQVQMLLRAGDPVFDLIMRCGGFPFENRVWVQTLANLAQRFGVNGETQIDEVCLDSHVQWAYVPNVWYNDGLRTALYVAAAPVRWILKSALGAIQRAPTGEAPNDGACGRET